MSRIHRIRGSCIVGVLVLAAFFGMRGTTRAVSATYTNSTPITITDSFSPPTKASIYPSNIAVSGLTGTIFKVKVTFTNLTHADPQNVDALLVGPNGQSVVLLSDTAGDAQITNQTFEFDDAASGYVPDVNGQAGGTFKPTNLNVDGTDVWPSPAPEGGYGTALSVFNGASANGTWSLYIVDDITGRAGTLGTWSLRITTLNSPVLSAIGDQLLDEGTTLTIPVTANDPDGGSLTFTTAGLPDFATLNVLANGSANLVLTPDYYDQGVYTGVSVTVSDGGRTDSETFSITVNNVNHPPVAAAGVDQSKDDTDGSGYELFTLDGSATTDPENNIVSYEWLENDVVFMTGVSDTHEFGTGVHTLTLRVTDFDGEVSTDVVVVEVVDVVAPTTTRNPSQAANAGGWNNQDVTLTLTAADNTNGTGVRDITYSASGAKTIAQTTVTSASATLTVNVNGTTTVTYYATDNAGNVEATRTVIIKLDKVKPVTTAPTESLIVQSQMGTDTAPVTISWSRIEVLSGVATYDLEFSTDGGAFAPVALANNISTSLRVYLAPTHTYQFRVRATDNAGNVGNWVTRPAFALDAPEEEDLSIAYTTGWGFTSQGGAYGGHVAYSRTGGAVATYTFTGRSVAWCAMKFADRGIAEVWLDGIKVATVDLYYYKASGRRLMYIKNAMPNTTHTLEIRVTGNKHASSTNVRVDIDNFVVLR